MNETPETTGIPLHLFEGYGIEIEWMIVDRESLDVRPITDEVLHKVTGEYTNEVERGPLCWSNELALHVIEVKSNGPARDLFSLPRQFQHGAGEINEILAGMNAMLLPTGAHPWMDPVRELKLWPHEHNPIYEAYNRIFHCQGHGWANLQSVHVNLPFSGDDEFARLHAAIRLVLPLLPALSASTPFLGGKRSPYLDARLDAYRHHMDAVPSLIGNVIPEPVYSRAAYEREILGRIYADLKLRDPEGVLLEEWANARGAIARFDRMAIEIRVLDTQECPQADLAIAAAASALARALCDESTGLAGALAQRAFPTHALADIFDRTLTHAGDAIIDDRDYLELFGCGEKSIAARELWRGLMGGIWSEGRMDRQHFGQYIDVILEQGCLARRIREAAGNEPDRAQLAQIYRKLSVCLAEGRQFVL